MAFLVQSIPEDSPDQIYLINYRTVFKITSFYKFTFSKIWFLPTFPYDVEPLMTKNLIIQATSYVSLAVLLEIMYLVDLQPHTWNISSIVLEWQLPLTFIMEKSLSQQSMVFCKCLCPFASTLSDFTKHSLNILYYICLKDFYSTCILTVKSDIL